MRLSKPKQLDNTLLLHTSRKLQEVFYSWLTYCELVFEEIIADRFYLKQDCEIIGPLRKTWKWKMMYLITVTGISKITVIGLSSFCVGQMITGGVFLLLS